MSDSNILNRETGWRSIALPWTDFLRLNPALPLSAVAFLVPAVFALPQWLTGTAINCLLFWAAERFNFKQRLPIIVLPSLGAVAHGVLFGPLTPFLVFFLPFIWLGNLALTEVVAASILRRWPFLARALAAALLKFSILFVAAQLYFSFALAPAAFLVSMGLVQLVTAIAGGAITQTLLKR